MSESSNIGRLDKLKHSLVNVLDQPELRIWPYREGADCWVDKVEWPNGPQAVVRSAKVEQLHTRYEGLVDFGAEMQKQILVSQLLDDHGIPTPAVIASHRSTAPMTEPSWMILEFVEHQGADHLDLELQSDLGNIARRIHTIQPPSEVQNLFPPSSPWASWITDRIVARLRAAATYLEIPDIERLRDPIAKVAETREQYACQLLHLDLRPPNLAIRNGKIEMVFDLANAIVGDPLLELARIRGCNLLTPAFLKGYGDELTTDLVNILDIYELDLCALLVTVSREEFDDPDLHNRMRNRTAFLTQQITSRAPG